jgi:uncharacterized DUF497 family protein
MRFEWDEHKNRQNLRKHDIGFETAVLVFDDPYALTQRDSAFDDEERWITVGAVGRGSILPVVHTFYEKEDQEVIRIISARATESHERRAYEEAHKGAEARHHTIAKKKDEDIDFSDVAPVLDWSGAEMGKFYRPKKKPVTMRLDSDVIAWLKADGRGYQTKANWLLRQAMTHLTGGTRTTSGGRRSRRVDKGK